MIKPRYYQAEAQAAVLRDWDSGIRRTLLSMATGTGKTIVFALLAETLIRRGERILVLAHREELLNQAQDKINIATGLGCAVEKAEKTAIDEWYRITVGSVQTLMRPARLEQFPRDYYDTIIIDEAHHTLADSYRRILAHFDKAKVLGVTATPDRGDMRNLGEVYESLAYEYPLIRAISDKYLCPIKAQTIPLNIDLNGIKTQAGDFKLGELDDALTPYLNAIADEMVAYCKDRKTVVFLPLIATSQKMQGILNDRGFRCGEVNHNSPDRAEILQDFTAGHYDVLCNSMLLTEGWDEPSADCIVCLRPTKIRSLYAQIIGRGTRLFPGKDHLLLLDFLWHSERHSLCRPANLVCDNQDLADKITEILARQENAAGRDLQEIIESGQAEVVAEREKQLAKKLAEQKARKRALVDPLQFSMSIRAEDIADYAPVFGSEMAPPSAAQIKMLEKAGICPDEVTNAGMASKLIDRVQARRDAGLTTPKQIRFLERIGFQHVGTWEFDSAKKLIDRIAVNRWRIPPGIIPEEYQPKGIA